MVWRSNGNIFLGARLEPQADHEVLERLCGARFLWEMAHTVSLHEVRLQPIEESAVNRELGSAQGTATCTTPCSGHSTRGTCPITIVRYCIVSRWRQRRSRAS